MVGQYVQLTQKGKNLLGLCPFHADTSPSFTVAPEKGIFHCFGCGAGGNVFSFLMQHQRLSFPEAVQELARRYGIPLTFKELGPEGSRETRKRTLAYEINQVAAGFYEATLKSAAGRPGRDYLAKRGLTRRSFRPSIWDMPRMNGTACAATCRIGAFPWRQRRKQACWRPAAAAASTTVSATTSSFPSSTANPGCWPSVGASSARASPNPQFPETQLYHKGRTLYGLPQAAEALRQTGVALVVEGYLDLIALQAHGIANVLATLGTAIDAGAGAPPEKPGAQGGVGL